MDKNTKIITAIVTLLMILTVINTVILATFLKNLTKIEGTQVKKSAVIDTNSPVNVDSGLENEDLQQMQNQSSNIPKSEVDDLRGAYSYTTQINEGTLYTSSIYSFSLVIPESWGEIREDSVTSASEAIKDTVRLSSIQDPSRNINIYIVNSQDARIHQLQIYQQ